MLAPFGAAAGVLFIVQRHHICNCQQTNIVDSYIYRRPEPARDPCSDRGLVQPLVGSTARKAFSTSAAAGRLDAAGRFNAAAGRLRILDAWKFVSLSL